MRERSVSMRSGRAAASGFTLLELMITVLLIGIFAAFALPGMQYLVKNTKVKSASSNIYLSLLRARSEAVKHNGPVTLAATSGSTSWGAGWKLTDANGTVLATQDEIRGITVTANVASLVYLSSGRIQGGVMPTFSISYPKKSSDKTSDIARCVSAQANGTPYVKTSTCS
jgi:type IV fimbrial biogenesis protein FimT